MHDYLPYLITALLYPNYEKGVVLFTKKLEAYNNIIPLRLRRLISFTPLTSKGLM